MNEQEPHGMDGSCTNRIVRICLTSLAVYGNVGIMSRRSLYDKHDIMNINGQSPDMKALERLGVGPSVLTVNQVEYHEALYN
jgi:hypothetical protein